MLTCSWLGRAVPLTCAGNSKFAATKACNASREVGFAASKRDKISAGADFGTASAKVLLSGNTCEVCTATNRFLKSTCGGVAAGAETNSAGCDCPCAADCPSASGNMAKVSAALKSPQPVHRAKFMLSPGVSSRGIVVPSHRDVKAAQSTTPDSRRREEHAHVEDQTPDPPRVRRGRRQSAGRHGGGECSLDRAAPRVGPRPARAERYRESCGRRFRFNGIAKCASAGAIRPHRRGVRCRFAL